MEPPVIQPVVAPVPQAPVPTTFSQVDTPLGPLTVVETDAGLAALGIDQPVEEILAELARRLPLQPPTPVPASESTRQLAAWFLRQRADFDLGVDLRGLPPFQQKVLTALLSVGPGQVCTYADLAAQVGSPRAARAVGNALGRNPIPVVVPCHRVLHGGGGLGGYTGGLHRKVALLEVEHPDLSTLPPGARQACEKAR